MRKLPCQASFFFFVGPSLRGLFCLSFLLLARWCFATSPSFFVVSGKFRKGVEQPVRPLCVPAGADCPQGRGRVPSGAPKMRFCENTEPHLLLFSGNFVPSHKTAARAWFLPCPLLLTKCRPEAERQTDESDPTLRPTEKARMPGTVINNIKETRAFYKTK